MSKNKIVMQGQYAGTVKRHNVCKRHIAIDNGFKFLHIISMGLKL